MRMKASNGTLNFLYRIFIAPDGVTEEEELNLASQDATEVALAKSQKEIDSKVDSHFSSNAGKGRGKFKVDNKVEKSQLQQVKESKAKGEKEASREDEGREIE